MKCPVSFLVKLEEGRVWRRHINQIGKSSNPTITNDGHIPNLWTSRLNQCCTLPLQILESLLTWKIPP